MVPAFALIPAVAAGHPATAEAGVEILAQGGSAADAAVAAAFTSCVAETVMTGLLGGGHAIYWDAASGKATNLDCFCAVPSGSGGELIGLDVPFGEELVHYAVGAARCGSATAVCRGRGSSSRRSGSRAAGWSCLLRTPHASRCSLR